MFNLSSFFFSIWPRVCFFSSALLSSAAGRTQWRLGCLRLTPSRLCVLLTGFHGGCQVSRAVHLLGVGVGPSLPGSASLPGVGGDPGRRKRSAPLCSRCQVLRQPKCQSRPPPLSWGQKPKVQVVGSGTGEIIQSLASGCGPLPLMSHWVKFLGVDQLPSSSAATLDILDQ